MGNGEDSMMIAALLQYTNTTLGFGWNGPWPWDSPDGIHGNGSFTVH